MCVREEWFKKLSTYKVPSPVIAVSFPPAVADRIDELRSKVSLTDNILGNISYGDHSPEYIFICRGWSISVFSRLTGQCVYAISATFGNYARLQWKIGGHRNKRSKSLRCIHGDVDDELLKAWDDAGSALYQHVVVKDKGRPKPLADRIIASTSRNLPYSTAITHPIARVSSCGKFLALLFETSRILIIRDLERLFKGEVSLHDCSVQVQLGRASRFSRYLAFEHGRIGVAAVGCCSFVASFT